MRSSSANQVATSADDSTPLGDVVVQYRSYVLGILAELSGQVADLRTAVVAGDRSTAKQRWLDAQCSWQQVGATYASFGAPGMAISGLASGLPLGVDDPAFTGLHRIEYGLYNGEGLLRVLPHVTRLARDVTHLRTHFDSVPIPPTDMPIRCHEILEDGLRDHLSGQDDYGSGMAYALTSADVLATRVILEELKPLIPVAVLGHSAYDQSTAALNILDAALAAAQPSRGQWPDYRLLTKHQRQPINGAIGAALEALYQVPFVLGKLT